MLLDRICLVIIGSSAITAALHGMTAIVDCLIFRDPDCRESCGQAVGWTVVMLSAIIVFNR